MAQAMGDKGGQSDLSPVRGDRELSTNHVCRPYGAYAAPVRLQPMAYTMGLYRPPLPGLIDSDRDCQTRLALAPRDMPFRCWN